MHGALVDAQESALQQLRAERDKTEAERQAASRAAHERDELRAEIAQLRASYEEDGSAVQAVRKESGEAAERATAAERAVEEERHAREAAESRAAQAAAKVQEMAARLQKAQAAHSSAEATRHPLRKIPFASGGSNSIRSRSWSKGTIRNSSFLQSVTSC